MFKLIKYFSSFFGISVVEPKFSTIKLTLSSLFSMSINLITSSESAKSIWENSFSVFLKVKIRNSLNIESSSRLKVSVFSLVTERPSSDEIYSVFLSSKRIIGITNIYKNK